MVVGSWQAPRQRLPVFADQQLMVSSIIHRPRCRAVSTDSDVTPTETCRCPFPRYYLERGTPVQVVGLRQHSALVQEQTSGAFWVERTPMRRVTEPRQAPGRHFSRHALPPDFLLVDTALADGPLKLPRRRRHIRGGEIVMIRGELGTPWRYLALTYSANTPIVLLLHPSLRIEHALKPDWTQLKTLPLSRDGKDIKLEQAVIPVFPIPDGTKAGVSDPGWLTEDKQLPV